MRSMSRSFWPYGRTGDPPGNRRPARRGWFSRVSHVYLHYALDLWFKKVVKPLCRGKALISRYADDFVCAFRYRSDAERFYRVLPKRLEKFIVETAPEKNCSL